jgi:hypothetical protein
MKTEDPVLSFGRKGEQLEWKKGGVAERSVGVGDGNRTRNIRSHSPVLCRLSYSHR